MRYKNDFLTNVIVRIDFRSGIEEIRNNLDVAISNLCLDLFPLARKIMLKESNVMVDVLDNQKTEIKIDEFPEWHFASDDLTQELTLRFDCVVIEHTTYGGFDCLRGQIVSVMEALAESYPGIEIRRLGLRYVNQIDASFDRNGPSNEKGFWSKYINEALLKDYDLFGSSGLLRHMSSVERSFSVCGLKFQYGIFNTDYPALNIKKVFVLDFDASSMADVDVSEFPEQLNRYHEIIIDCFENAITQKTRDMMGVKESEE